MADTTTMQVRVDKEVRDEASKICEALGIDLPTYIRMSISRMVKERGIPFGLKIDTPAQSEEISLLKEISLAAEKNGTSNMSLAEINAEITAARKERQ